MAEEKYLSIKKEGYAEYEDRKSLFIGYAKPVSSKIEATDFIAAIRKKHSDARHVCYAYCVRLDNAQGYSDDGEPQGTAGVPMLDIIKKKGLTDIAVAVVRYFGGILLGTGGLVKAYTTSCVESIQDASPVEYKLYSVMTATCSYQEYGKLQKELERSGYRVFNTLFLEAVTMDFLVPIAEKEGITYRFSELSCGKVIPTEKETRFDCN